LDAQKPRLSTLLIFAKTIFPLWSRNLSGYF
jgi:hypothetical protein